MLKGLGDVLWDQEIQPSDNPRGAVPRALCALAASTRETGNEAGIRVRYSLGNAHAGTYFPVVLAVIPFLGELLREGGTHARIETLEILIDLLASYEPEQGFDLVETAGGLRPLKELVREKIAGLEADVERCLTAATSPDEVRPAQEILSVLRD
ncbi:hypothetical protein OV207_22580 [Corallococcus sp. BB11-1]|uniref:hypothetical protein n=1 Tax=Corallococcus sp. BB11-1 TaxID=2996783 RepID=UPI00226FEC1F|nr:hypothetical protein [Corallococcus sp. BB11-1]MCY1034259.1 hypothetical protein [Corallococcus sp. BB11-1]